MLSESTESTSDINPLSLAPVSSRDDFTLVRLRVQQMRARVSEKSTKVHATILKVGLSIYYKKQLLDEVEHDIVNYQNRGLCYQPKPKAEADNTDTRF